MFSVRDNGWSTSRIENISRVLSPSAGMSAIIADDNHQRMRERLGFIPCVNHRLPRVLTRREGGGEGAGRRAPLVTVELADLVSTTIPDKCQHFFLILSEIVTFFFHF
jgi:hypothetical protein